MTRRLPIDAIVDFLAAKARIDPAGAKSLDHVLVVVPTAQSGRRLRQALAKRFGALVPPLVKTPPGIMLDEDDPALATRTDEIAAFAAALPDGSLELARQLADIRAALSAKALSFADVAAAIAADMPDEAERWRSLAETEERYIAALEKRGRKDRIAAMKSFRPEWPGIEETVRLDDPSAIAALPGLDLPGGPSITLAQIRPCATAADEAARIAGFFASVKDDEALPALCVADPRMFPEIVTAMKARGLDVHDPSETRLCSSSLGHLVSQIVSLKRTSSYRVFSAFVRGGDVRRWLCAELRKTEEEMTAALADLDNRQAEYLPEKISDVAPKTSGTLRAVFDHVTAQLRKKDLCGLLASIFKGRTLDAADPASREFAAAAEVVGRLAEECAGDDALLELRLEEETYSLEPDQGDTILADGWMELPFVEADELVIAGMCEGRVPESVVGHPFLPDSLRRRLGLPDNASKEKRDRAIFRLAALSRDPGAVTVRFHSIDPNGDVLKPSRLLFETDDDADLTRRVRTLYGIRAGTAEGSASDLPSAWRLKLPFPPKRRKIEKISPTRLDGYLRCPFTSYLRDSRILGDKRLDDRAEELAAWEYGNLAHDALEAFGNSPLKDSADAGEIRDFLYARVDAALGERFGTSVPSIVALQGESVKRRLSRFAVLQAERRGLGWEIAAVERKLELQYGETRFHGKCDRIDFRPDTGEWCVIDYKTWDSAANAKCFETGRDGSRTWKSLQLPIYCAMLDADREGAFAAARLDRISSCYCVLGKTADDTVFSEPFAGACVPEAEEKIRELLGRLERGIHWPPSPAGEWRYDYAEWLLPSPENTVDEAWIEDQNLRLREADA